MRAILLVLAVLLPGAALAHNGEYHAPLAPPRIRPVEPVPGEPSRPGEATGRDGGAVTPREDGGEASRPLPSPPIPPAIPEPGVSRDDDRLTLRIWWETARDRYLPSPGVLPHPEELVRVLLEASRTESRTVRNEALIALGRIRAATGAEEIAAAAADDDPAFPLLALGLLGRPEGAERLRAVVQDGEAEAHERAFAVLALGFLGRKEDRAFVREVANEEWEPNIRTAAVLAMGWLGDTEGVHILGRILLDAHPLRSPAGEGPTGDRVLIGLRCAAARSLGRVLTPKAYDYLVWAVDRAPPVVAANAAEVLGAAPGRVGIPALLRALEPGRPFAVRQAALLALAGRGDPLAAGEARRILDSPPDRAGPAGPFAALALGHLPDAKPAEELLEIVENREERGELRAAAAIALGILGDRASAPRLEKALHAERDPLFVGLGLVADALIRGPGALDLAKRILAESDLPDPRRDAVVALRILADATTADLLVEELADSYHVNREAAIALARVDPRRAATELTAKLTDPNLNARRFAAHCLGVLLEPERPRRIAGLLQGWTPLSGAPMWKACVYLENEYLYALIRNF